MNAINKNLDHYNRVRFYNGKCPYGEIELINTDTINGCLLEQSIVYSYLIIDGDLLVTLICKISMANWDDKISIFKREFWLEYRLNKFLIFPHKSRTEKEERELEKKLKKIDKNRS